MAQAITAFLQEIDCERSLCGYSLLGMAMRGILSHMLLTPRSLKAGPSHNLIPKSQKATVSDDFQDRHKSRLAPVDPRMSGAFLFSGVLSTHVTTSNRPSQQQLTSREDLKEHRTISPVLSLHQVRISRFFPVSRACHLRARSTRGFRSNYHVGCNLIHIKPCYMAMRFGVDAPDNCNSTSPTYCIPNTFMRP